MTQRKEDEERHAAARSVLWHLDHKKQSCTKLSSIGRSLGKVMRLQHSSDWVIDEHTKEKKHEIQTKKIYLLKDPRYVLHVYSGHDAGRGGGKVTDQLRLSGMV